MRKSIFFLIFFFFNIFLNNTFADEKIVFIDINFIFNNSEAGKDLKLKISKKNNDLQTEINKFKTEIDEKRKKILSQKNVLSADEYNNKVKSLEQQVKKINSIISTKRDSLKAYQTKIENSFSNNLNNLIEEYSDQNSIDIILNKKDLLMAKKELDITEKIFNLFNERIKKIIIK
tara:strand:+ start:2849 stop:3373 length:525 start_codon:yes stop_codon:yes gene_type:complete